MTLLFCSLITVGCGQGSPSKNGGSPAKQSNEERFQEWLSVQEHYLYDVNSPYRDEEAYIPVLEEIINSPYADSAQKVRAERDLPLFSLNRIGQPASDFRFTLRTGRQQSLYEVSADHILLIFSNPGCEACKEVQQKLEAESGIRQMMEDGSLKVVNIYPDDNLEDWMENSAEYPSKWISGYAPQVDEAKEGELPLYNIRAIPTFYLLDREHRTLVKDAPLERIAAYLLQES